jgi:uncharacterized membrane protein
MLTEPLALVISAIVEAPIAYLIVRLCRWPCRGPLHAGAASAVATAVTHPQFWNAVIWAAPRLGYWPSVVGGEALVVLVEGALIAWMADLRIQRAMLVSLVANTASCAVGLFSFFG